MTEDEAMRRAAEEAAAKAAAASVAKMKAAAVMSLLLVGGMAAGFRRIANGSTDDAAGLQAPGASQAGSANERWHRTDSVQRLRRKNTKY